MEERSYCILKFPLIEWCYEANKYLQRNVPQVHILAHILMTLQSLSHGEVIIPWRGHYPMERSLSHGEVIIPF